MFSIRHVVIAATLVVHSCLTTATDKKIHGQLKALARNYPVLEKQALAALPAFGHYCTTVDTSLIEICVNIVKESLKQDTLTLDEIKCIKKIAATITRGPIYKNASASSRWRNAAKQAIILTLSQTAAGTAILDQLAADNPQLQNEKEAYCAI